MKGSCVLHLLKLFQVSNVEQLRMNVFIDQVSSVFYSSKFKEYSGTCKAETIIHVPLNLISICIYMCMIYNCMYNICFQL